MNQNGTTGGGSATPMVVTTAAAFTSAIAGTTARVIHVMGSFSGSFGIGSNKTVIGLCGARITGHIGVSGSVNVIVRNLTIVGNNRSDSPNNCSGGADAVTISNGAHHVWFDHCDISDGSDGNLDTTSGSDFVTISYTKFWYSTMRTDPEQGASGLFSNLIGLADNVPEDAGHRNVTFHHCWWAQNVNQRMPRCAAATSTCSTTLARRPATATAPTRASRRTCRREQRLHRREQPAVARRERRHAGARQPVPEHHRPNDRQRRGQYAAAYVYAGRDVQPVSDADESGRAEVAAGHWSTQRRSMQTALRPSQGSRRQRTPGPGQGGIVCLGPRARQSQRCSNPLPPGSRRRSRTAIRGGQICLVQAPSGGADPAALVAADRAGGAPGRAAGGPAASLGRQLLQQKPGK